MYRIIAVVLVSLELVLMTGCVNPNGTQNNTTTGALIGGALGASAGAAAGGRHAGGRNVLVGDLAGVIVGGLVGHMTDREQQQRLRQQSPQTWQTIQHNDAVVQQQQAAQTQPSGQALPIEGVTPITVDDIKALTAAGVKPDAITKEIDISQSQFSPQDIATAQQANPPVNADVIAYMKNHPKELKTGDGGKKEVKVSVAIPPAMRNENVSNSEVLTNNSIVELVKNGISEEIIVSMIKNQPTKFDVGVGGVLLLKSNSVSDTIVKEMVVREKGAIVAPATSVISDPAVEKLCVSLEQDNPSKVIDALKKLRNMKATEATPKILPCLTHTNPDVVREACRTLVVIGNQDAIPAITPLLTHERPDIIREACRTIAIIGNKDAIPAIEPLLMNSRSDIREEAYKAITKLQAQ